MPKTLGPPSGWLIARMTERLCFDYQRLAKLSVARWLQNMGNGFVLRMPISLQIHHFFPGFTIMKTTAAMQMAMPRAIFVVRGSLKKRVPMRMAVRGSKTPRMAVFVGPM